MAARTMAMRIPARSAAFARVVVPARSIATTSAAMMPRLVARTQPQVATKNMMVMQQRGYAAGSGLSKQEIQNRVFEVLKSFEKVDPSQVSASSSFTSDLGLDSLDAVEVVMAIEEEFSIEIPDAEADAITSVQQAIDYVAKTPSAN